MTVFPVALTYSVAVINTPVPYVIVLVSNVTDFAPMKSTPEVSRIISFKVNAKSTPCKTYGAPEV